MTLPQCKYHRLDDLIWRIKVRLTGMKRNDGLALRSAFCDLSEYVAHACAAEARHSFG
jgi:hypothetical protein